MAASKRLRFEVMRRDNHACRYCGAMAPDVKLTVDHVVPVALGGKDEASNLVTACQPCNAGKSSAAPDTELVDDVAQDALRWSRARSAAIADWRDSRAALKATLSAFVEAWDAWGVGPEHDRRAIPRDPGWEDSCERWLDEGLKVDDLIDLIPKAMHNKPTPRGGTIVPEKRWTYYCGVVWRTLDRIQAETAEALARSDAGAGDDAQRTEAEQDAFRDGWFAAVEWAACLADKSTGEAPTPCFSCRLDFAHGASSFCLRCWAVLTEPAMNMDFCPRCGSIYQCPAEVPLDEIGKERCAGCASRSDALGVPALEKFPPADPRWG